MTDDEAREEGYLYYGLILGIVPGYADEEEVTPKYKYTEYILDALCPLWVMCSEATGSEPGFSFFVKREL